MKFTKRNLIIGVAIIGVLVAAFWWGGNAPGLQGWSSSEDGAAKAVAQTEEVAASSQTPEVKVASGDLLEKSNQEKLNQEKLNSEKSNQEKTEKPAAKSKPKPGGAEGNLKASEKVKLAKELANKATPTKKGDANYSAKQGMAIDKKTGKDKYQTAPVPEGKPVPMEPQNTKVTETTGTCTISVRCDTILANLDWLDKEKLEMVPTDGIILASTTATFYEGESVFNVLMRELKKAKIPLEFTNTPIYNSAYIEGIHNLYEYDCGELSGWMYKVNDWFPNYGCSRYQVKAGDVIEWVYTCDLGVDVGGFVASGS